MKRLMSPIAHLQQTIIKLDPFYKKRIKISGESKIKDTIVQHQYVKKLLSRIYSNQFGSNWQQCFSQYEHTEGATSNKREILKSRRIQIILNFYLLGYENLLQGNQIDGCPEEIENLLKIYKCQPMILLDDIYIFHILNQNKSSQASMNNYHLPVPIQHPHLHQSQTKICRNQPQNLYLMGQHERPKLQLTHVIKNGQYAHPQIQGFSSENNISQKDHSLKMQSRVDLPSQKAQEEHMDGKMVNNHVYTFMRQQVELAVKNYQERFGQIIKSQAKQIQKLGAIIAQNQRTIVKQAETLKKIQQFRGEESSSSYFGGDRSEINQQTPRKSKSPKKISLTKGKTATKMTVVTKELSPPKKTVIGKSTGVPPMGELTRRLDQLTVQLQGLQEQHRIKNNNFIDLQRKVNKLDTELFASIFSRLSSAKITLEKYLIQIEKKQGNLQQTLQRFTKQNKNKEMNYLLLNLREQMEDLGRTTANLMDKQYNYDSFQVQNLGVELSKLKGKINHMQSLKFAKKEQFAIEKEQIYEKKHQISQINQRQFQPQKQDQKHHQVKVNTLARHQSAGMTYSHRLNGTNLNNSQISYVSSYSPAKEDKRNIQQWPKKVQIKNAISVNQMFEKSDSDINYEESDLTQFEDCEDSCTQEQEDEFFYPQVKSDIVVSHSSSQLQEQRKESRLQNIDRLIGIIKRKSMRLPVRIEVDQTGYAKYASNGMYILDQNGDGFDLTADDIFLLKKQGIACL